MEPVYCPNGHPNRPERICIQASRALVPSSTLNRQPDLDTPSSAAPWLALPDNQPQKPAA